MAEPISSPSNTRSTLLSSRCEIGVPQQIGNLTAIGKPHDLFAKYTGTGRYLPERVLTNFDLEKMVDTTDEWIRTRTGVERRHIVTAEDDDDVGHVRRGREECDWKRCRCQKTRRRRHDHASARRRPDLDVSQHSYPGSTSPWYSGMPRHRSLEAACTGFIYALTTADKYIKARRREMCVLGHWRRDA